MKNPNRTRRPTVGERGGEWARANEPGGHYGWTVQMPDGRVVSEYVRSTPQKTKAAFHKDFQTQTFKHYENIGFKCVKILIFVIDSGGDYVR